MSERWIGRGAGVNVFLSLLLERVGALAPGSRYSRVQAGVFSLLVIALALVAAPALAHPPVVERVLPAVGEYFGLGVTHILSGVDHLLFLTALVLGAGRVRDVLYTISAFTLAHSITLALGVLGLVHPNPLAVEVLIALSIAYVAFENLLGRGGKARFAVTLAFGLVHGLGFASALREVGVSQQRMLPSLLLFNVGVEAGQLGVLMIILPAVRWLQRGGAGRASALRGCSAALVAVGLLWAGQRLFEQPDALSIPTAEASLPASRALARAAEPGKSTPRSVYPSTTGVLGPEVERVCGALSALPRERRAACTGHKPGIALTSECERMLNAAVSDGSVALAPAAAERCVADQQVRYGSCAFTTATALAPLDSCSAMLIGKRALGASCRSSLECSSGLHCKGASPVEVGVCAAPSPAGARCGLATDALGAYLPSREADHAECSGSCIRNHCASPTTSRP
jgi:hypothetical protein